VVMSIGSLPVLVALDLFGVSGVSEGVLNTTGFWYATASSLQFYFTTPDCTGSPYWPVFAIFRYGVPYHGQTLYYAKDPVQAIPVASVQVFDTSLTNSLCLTVSFTAPAGPVATFDLRGFIPPFHVR
jgi:hypothetical protein